MCIRDSATAAGVDHGAGHALDGAVMATLTLVAAYDGSSDPRRARLAALLQGYGDRIQKSVFIVRADATGIEDLRRDVYKRQS